MSDGNTFWGIVGGLGMLALWIRIVLSWLRTERHAKRAADAMDKLVGIEERREWLRTATAMQAQAAGKL